MTARSAEYEAYCKRERARGVEPLSYRKYCEAMDEYEREWEVAGYEYEQAEASLVNQEGRSEL